MSVVNFPILDTPPLYFEEFSDSFEIWLSRITDTINNMFYTGKYNYSGGSATVNIDIDNMSPEYICYAQLESSANAVGVINVTPIRTFGPDVSQLEILFSGDPGISVISFLILRTV